MEFAEFSDEIFIDIYNFDKNKKEIMTLCVEQVPAICILNKSQEDRGICFHGIQKGYEFHSFLGSILVVSKNYIDLLENLIKKVTDISTSLKIQTFVRLTFPYCSFVVRLIYKMVFLNPHIQADMIDVAEFPNLAKKMDPRRAKDANKWYI